MKVKSEKTVLRVLVLLTILLVGFGNTLWAQVDTGAILGTVKDQSGAVVPGAKVTLANEGTTISLTAQSSSDGSYSFSPIKIGTYTLTVEQPGFQKASQTGITVDIQQQSKVDVTLVPGQVTQTVEVVSAAPQLQTQNASVGQVANTQQINDLPLNGRNYTFLAQLGPGVTKLVPTRGLDASGSFSANGLTTVHNNYILDGIDNNNDTVDFLNGAAYATLPPPDAIQEFKVQTSNFSAEFGRAGGAVVNATIKSGTNHIHGSLWEFVRNDKFDASDFFANAAGVTKGKLRRNQYGGSAGGPVYIPHIYNGKNKTFWFGDYEGTRISQEALRKASVPTAAERASGYTDFRDVFTGVSGNVTDLLGRSFQRGAILDPATTRPVTSGLVDPVTGLVATKDGFVRDPFYTGGSILGMTDFTTDAQMVRMNQLPVGRLNANAIKILNLFPAPNNLRINNNFIVNRPTPDSSYHFDVRVDHNFNEKDQMFGRVSYGDRNRNIPGNFTGLGNDAGFGAGDVRDLSFNSALSETHSFSPTMINELRYGFSRLYSSSGPPFTNTLGIPAQFGIQGIPQFGGNGGLPYIGIGGLSDLGAGGFASPNWRISDTSQITENLTKIHNSHTFKGGFEFQALRFPWTAPPWSRGGFSFGGFTGVSNETGGVGQADILLSPMPTTVPGGFDNVGGPNTVFASRIYAPDDIRHYYGTYLQDDWKTTPKLTVNLGLRWEYFGQIREKYGAQANFIPGPAGAGAAYLINTRRKGDPPLSQKFVDLLAKDGIALGYSNQPGLTNTPLTDFAPRIGLAYQFSPKLVARAGYGIYFGGFENIGGSPDPGANYPFGVNLSIGVQTPGHGIIYPDGTNATIERGLLSFPADPSSPAFNPFRVGVQSFQTPWKVGYTQEYNISFQYQLTPNQSVTLGYVGNTSRHMMNTFKTNSSSQILPLNTDVYKYVPFPDLGRDDDYIAANGDAYYNALQATFERRFSGGLSTLLAYTHSRCMTDNRNALGIAEGRGQRAPLLPGFGGKGDYVRCGTDVPNIMHLSGIWQVPIGEGRHFLNHGGIADKVIGGWSTNFILTLQDGFPFTIGCPKGTTSNFGCNALLVPGADIYAGPHNISQWLNPAAFAQPPVAKTIGQADYSPLGGAGTQAHGPGYHRLDFSIFKGFRTSESTHLELRTEFFNLTNTPQFGNPSQLNFTNLKDFSYITGLIDGKDDPRQIQFALKFVF